MDESSAGSIIALIVLALAVIFVLVTVAKAIRIVPQATAVIVERLGRYSQTLDAGLHFLIPFIDRPRAVVDLREQVVSFPPQPVITSDNLVVSIDTVIYFQPTDPKSAVYEIANYIQGIEQLTVTTLRNVIGSLDLEQTLTSRDQINGQLRGVLDEATGRWGIRVNRVELKAIDPPHSVQDSMEQQMRAERSRRAAILTAEGVKQSQILTAEGDKQSAVLRAEGQAQSAILKAEGESRAILQVFDAIHRGNPDSKLLAYQYLQTLPQIANSASSKLWIVPSELTKALESITSALGGASDGTTASVIGDLGLTSSDFDSVALENPQDAVRRAQAESAQAVADAEGARQSAQGATGGRGASYVPPAAPMSPSPAGTTAPDLARSGEADPFDQTRPVRPPNWGSPDQQP